MARTKGMLNLSGNLEVNAQAPLDARTIVPTEADLTVANNFPYPYIGLEVYVTGTGKKFRLVNLDTTQSSSWHEVAEGGGGTLPIATASTLGGVKIGNGISVQSDGTISVSGGGGGSITPSLSVVDVDSVFSGVDITVKSDDEIYNVTKNFGNYRYITFDLPWEGNYTVNFISPSAQIQVSKQITINILGGYEYYLHDVKYGYFDFLENRFTHEGAAEKTYTSEANEKVLMLNFAGASASSTNAFTETFSTTGTVEEDLIDNVTTGSSAGVLSDSYKHVFSLREISLNIGDTITKKITSNGYYTGRCYIYKSQKALSNAPTKVFIKGFFQSSSSIAYKDYTHTVTEKGVYLAFAAGLPSNSSSGPADVDIQVNGDSVVSVDQSDELHIKYLGANGKFYTAFAELDLEVDDELYLKIGAGFEQGAIMGLIKLS